MHHHRARWARTLPLLIAILLLACSGPKATEEPAATGPLFKELSAEESGIRFSNDIVESDRLNYYTYQYAYNGGGVAVGDLDNDGLPDLYFTGNEVPDKVYRNLGGLRFEDITDKAITSGTDGWHTGVVMADVNGDGLMDIYVCRAGWWDDRSNMSNLLYINNGDLTFTERGREFGVADTGRSTHAVFFDYDRDGDLDLYVMNAPLQTRTPITIQRAAEMLREGTAPTDRLYRNDGGRFTDVTTEAGLGNAAYGLGLTVTDLDLDGWPDIHVANDYVEADHLYMNTDGLFRDRILAATRHISNFSMGCDVADINNDGLPDIVVLDMVSEDHVRSKRNMGGMDPESFWWTVHEGFHHQYMTNTLQLNNGNGTFSEIAQMAGIARTDWSWAPLIADLDNDGWKDILITNGLKRDMRDRDFADAFDHYRDTAKGLRYAEVLDLVPATRIRNYLYRNNGDLTFSDSSQAWGFLRAINSNGAVYADLDGDGDLDLVVNNMDEPATIYENRLDVLRPERRHLRLRVVNDKGTDAIGARVELRHAGGVQAMELQTVRGFQSSVEPVLHFGTGTVAAIDSVAVYWPDGRYLLLRNVATNATITVRPEGAAPVAPTGPPTTPLLVEHDATRLLDHVHREDPHDDFRYEVLLPHKMSELGPLLGTGDVDGDGRDDVMIGGPHGEASVLWLQRADGSFSPAPHQPWRQHAGQEHLGSLFFDADGDGHLDLLLLAGSNQFDLRQPVYTQRLYLNDGKGRFTEAVGALPAMMTSAMRADAADIDGDGDLDLFIGGRQTPGHYPYPPRSYLLVNDGKGRFTEATQERIPEAMGPGMVTAVRFADMDGDGRPDLLLAGEWMGLKYYHNTGGTFVDRSSEAGFDDTEGWWWALEVADLDGDGRPDLVAGNLGWNSKFHPSPKNPLHIYWADFDDDGRSDIVLAKEKDRRQLPVRGLECSSQQCPVIAQRFGTFADFANADLPRIYTAEKLEKALHRKAVQMRSSVFMNQGGARFTRSDLPNLAQTAPIKGIVVMDVDGDGHQDLVVAGNMWGAEVETVRYDAGTGLVLLGDGRGGFTPVPSHRSGFFAWGHVKDLALLRTGDGRAPLLLVANNDGRVQLFSAAGRPVSGLSAR